MSWLRIDDGFTNHPKVLALGTKARRWTWMEILTYTCRYQSPKVPARIADVVSDATPRYVELCVEIGLIDLDKNGEMTVHDWHIYNASTVEERVRAYLKHHPNSTANDIHRSIGGKREIVIAAVTEIRLEAESSGSLLVPIGTQSGSQTGTREPPLPVPLARAREPVPNQTPEPEGPNVNAKPYDVKTPRPQNGDGEHPQEPAKIDYLAHLPEFNP